MKKNAELEEEGMSKNVHLLLTSGEWEESRVTEKFDVVSGLWIVSR